MEELSIMSERQYGSSLLRFQQWIAEAKQDIEAMSSEVRNHPDRKKKKHVTAYTDTMIATTF